MEEVFNTVMIVGLLIGSAIGGLALWPLAKYMGKISNAAYGNSFLICLISSSINLLIWYLMGPDAYLLGFEIILLLNIIILSMAYISIGRFIWNSTWLQSVKANIIWISVYALFMAYSLSQF